MNGATEQASLSKADRRNNGGMYRVDVEGEREAKSEERNTDMKHVKPTARAAGDTFVVQFLSPGYIFHVGVDLVLASMVLAGIKLVTGYELSPHSVAHTENAISFVKRYLQLGEWLFQHACSRAVKSPSFKRVNWKEMSQSFSSNFLGSTMRLMDDFQKAFDKSTGAPGARKIEEL